jgi:hypothetical protein
MHLHMQDDQISQKFIGLTPADMDRLPYLINTKKVFSSKQPSLSAGITPKSSLPCLQGLIVHFSLVLFPSRPKISMCKTGLHHTYIRYLL